MLGIPVTIMDQALHVQEITLNYVIMLYFKDGDYTNH
jgi:hypothetical protein